VTQAGAPKGLDAAWVRENTLAIARGLVARGFSVFPLDHPDDTWVKNPADVGKTPAVKWGPYQKVRPTDAELVSWFGNGRRRNVAGATGVVSHVVVVDGDSAEGLAWMRRNLPPTPMRTQTAKGEHWFYGHPGVRVPNKGRIKTGDPAVKIDIRGDGGYVVMVGSLHRTRVAYEPLGTWPPVAELPTFDPAWIEEPSRVERLIELLVEHYPPDGERWRFFEALSGFFLGTLNLDSAEALAIIDGAANRAGDHDTSPRPDEWVRRTEARLKTGEECTGAPTVATLIGAHGPAVVAQIRKWCGGTTGLAHPLTEAGDAECFAELYQDRVRYDHRRGRFLVSDESSGIWVPDPVECLTQMAIDMARERQRQANTIKNADDKKMAWTWAFRGEGRGRIINALALARSVPPIADAGDHWDEDPLLLGVQNGVVDLSTGRFRKAVAADRVTMRVRVAYDPAAGCPLWIKTLDDIFAPSDANLIGRADREVESQRVVEFVQRAIGYSITGDCREECCFFTWGDGANGKGTVMNTLGWLLGDYTDDMPYSTLERSERGSGIPNDIAKMVGKRFITCAEVNEFNLNEARLKALTGRDPMTARFLHREFFTFIPVCKIWVATNNKPQIVGQDDGIWRRIHLIPFTRKFEGKEANKQLKDQLRGELPGILNWCIAGALAWQREGLNPPETVKAATDAYRQESNPITPFVEACCVVGVGQVQAKKAYEAYEAFCRDSGVEQWKRLSNKAFFRAMEQRFEKKDGRQVLYVGVGLKDATREMPRADDSTPVDLPMDVDDSMAANSEEEAPS
jgi:P4 family phage/plasmid primase-like protien